MAIDDRVMQQLLTPSPPGPAEISDRRSKAGLTQQQAADLIGYSRRGWQDAESGKTKMQPAAWALFLLATDQHPEMYLLKNPVSCD